MMFILTHVAGLEEVAKLNGYQDVDPDTVRASWRKQADSSLR